MYVKMKDCAKLRLGAGGWGRGAGGGGGGKRESQRLKHNQSLST
jgi:hypothetical protein